MMRMEEAPPDRAEGEAEGEDMGDLGVMGDMGSMGLIVIIK